MRTDGRTDRSNDERSGDIDCQGATFSYCMANVAGAAPVSWEVSMAVIGALNF